MLGGEASLFLCLVPMGQLSRLRGYLSGRTAVHEELHNFGFPCYLGRLPAQAEECCARPQAVWLIYVRI